MDDAAAIRAVPGGYEATVSDQSPDTGEVSAEAAREAKIQRFMERALQRFKTSKNGEAQLRANFLDDATFAAGTLDSVSSTQWDPQVQQDRRTEQRPCLTVNRQPAFIRQITGQLRQNPQSLVVSPFDSKADPDTAEVFQGLIRAIYANSDGEVAELTAADHAARIGRGGIRINAHYASDETVSDQDLVVERIRNAFSVYPDPASRAIDGRDMRYCFIVEDMPNDEYALRFGHEAPGPQAFAEAGLVEFATDWAPTGKTKIAEYYFLDRVADRALLLADGRQILESTCQAVEPGTEPQLDGMDPRPVEMAVLQDGTRIPIERTRTVQRKVFKRATIDGLRILEGNEDLTDGVLWPGDRIPLVPVLGEETDINGRVDLRGVVRDNKDPSRMFNYFVTTLTENIALSKAPPWEVEMRSIAKYQAIWKSANRSNYPYLPYDSYDASDPSHPIPAPKRTFAEPHAIQAIVAAIAQFDNAQKAVTGLWDASLGERGPQESGKAIAQRQQQGGIGTAHFPANLAIARRAVGRILVQLIPRYYDAGRIVRILGLDDKPRTVMVYAGAQNAPQDQAAALQQLGIDPATAGTSKAKHLFDLGVGRYDVTVSTGPSYQTQRQEAASMILELIRAVPQIGGAVADLLVGNLDFPGHEALQRRLQKVLGVSDEDSQQDIPPEFLAQAQQAQALINALGEQLNAAKDALNTQILALQSKERIAHEQAVTDLAIASAKAENDAALSRLQLQVQAIDRLFEFSQRQLEAERQASTQAARAVGSGPAGPAAVQATGASQ